MSKPLRSDLIFLVRHGEAEASHPKGDRHRALTAQGIDIFTQTAQVVRPLGAGFSRVVTSPFVRAVETARVLARVLGVTDVQQVDELGADAATDAGLAAFVRGVGSGVAVVAHNPTLTHATALLLDRDANEITFPVGGIVVISMATERPRLTCVARPGADLRPDF
jgi:phosphohistidine phosphatase